MKLFYTRTFDYRPAPFPCWIVYEKTIKYFLGIPIKSKMKKKKDEAAILNNPDKTEL